MKSTSDCRYRCLNHGDLLPKKEDSGSIDYRRVRDGIGKISQGLKNLPICKHLCNT